MKSSAVLLTLATTGAYASTQDVLSDISSIDSQVKSLTTAVNNFNSIADASGLISAESALDSAIKKGTTDADALGMLSESDASSVLGAVKNLIPDIVDSLNAVVAKNGAFTSAGVESVVTGDVMMLQSDSDSFADALIKAAPADMQNSANSAKSCIDAAFASALATKTASAACASDISVGSGSSAPASSSAAAPTSSAAAPSSSAPASSSESAPKSSTTAAGVPAASTPASSAVATSAASSSVASVLSSPSGPVPAPAPGSGSGSNSSAPFQTFTGSANAIKAGGIVGTALLIAIASFIL